MLSKLVTPWPANASMESIRVMPSRCSSVSGARTSSIAIEAVKDVVGLERNHASEGDALVAHLLQLPDAVGVTGGAPALGRSDRFNAQTLVGDLGDELFGEAQGEQAALRPGRVDGLKGRAWVRSRR